MSEENESFTLNKEDIQKLLAAIKDTEQQEKELNSEGSVVKSWEPESLVLSRDKKGGLEIELHASFEPMPTVLDIKTKISQGIAKVLEEKDGGE